MFTGLVEETGIIKSITRNKDGLDITISAELILDEIKVDDSVAVNGVCLTVVNFNKATFTVNTINETVKNSTIGLLKNNDKVNLERALKLSDRLGGHLVQGHIDGLGKLERIILKGLGKEYYFNAKPEILRYIVKKGSVCLDGISLTVKDVTGFGFSVAVIPHSLDKTIIKSNWLVGTTVNIETDIIGRYLEKFLSKNGENINQNNLIEKLANLGY